MELCAGPMQSMQLRKRERMTALEKSYKEGEQKSNPEQQSEPKTLSWVLIAHTIPSYLVTTSEPVSECACVSVCGICLIISEVGFTREWPLGLKHGNRITSKLVRTRYQVIWSKHMLTKFIIFFCSEQKIEYNLVRTGTSNYYWYLSL